MYMNIKDIIKNLDAVQMIGSLSSSVGETKN